MQRRLFIPAAATALLVPALAHSRPNSVPEPNVARLEQRSRGRLGVFALDTFDERRVAYRQAEHFPMCSTFKVLAVAAVLARVDCGAERLDRRIALRQSDLLAYAPVTEQHVRDGSMSVASLCAAAIEWSDNTAANLLLTSLGGPTAVTRYARAIGDSTTRLDRNEPSLNSAIAGDPRDTTTPEAMADSLRSIVLGSALSAPSRERLRGWLQAGKTGTNRLRAGVPRTWRAGDKTGTGERGTSNDVAIFWPPGRKPIIVTVYLTGSPLPAGARDAILADVGTLVSRTLS
jgi:beta-lactamase class A